MSHRSLIVPLLLSTIACTNPAVNDSEESGTSTAETTGETETGTETETETETGEDPATRGLPEGESTWSGTIEVNDFPLAIDATLINSGGDLEMTFRITDLGDFVLTGTHEPASGLVALAGDDWLAPPTLDIELFGFIGSYDPDTLTLTGMSSDFASGQDNVLRGGPGTLMLMDGPGQPTAVGDEGAALSEGTHNFTGTSQCTSSERELDGTIAYDGAGGVSGSVTLGDPDLATALGTFEFTGVHNPTTGGITLVPGLWVDPMHMTLTFFVDGTYDPATGMYDGDMRTNTNACTEDGWHIVIE